LWWCSARSVEIFVDFSLIAVRPSSFAVRRSPFAHCPSFITHYQVKPMFPDRL